MSNSRYLLIFVLLLAALFFNITLSTTIEQTQSTQTVEEIPDHTIFSNKPSGYRAWQLTTEKTNFALNVWRKSFHELNHAKYLKNRRSLMLMLLPGESFSKYDIEPLLKWVEQGSTLVVLGPFNSPAANELRQELGFTIEKSAYSGNLQQGQLYSLKKNGTGLSGWYRKLFEHIDLPLVTTSPYRVYKPGSEILLLDEKNEPALISFRYERGQIITGAIDDMGSNAFLHDEVDNYQFITNLLYSHRIAAVFINEYIHGYGKKESIVTYYDNTPLLSIFGQLTFLFLAALWLSFAPWQTARYVRKLPRTIGMVDFIQSFSGLYWRKKSSTKVIRPILKEIDHILKRRYHIHSTETHKVQTLLTKLMDNPKEAIEILERSRDTVMNHKKCSHYETLKMVQQLTKIQETLYHASQRTRR